MTLHSPEMLDHVRWCVRMRDLGYYLYTGEPADWFAGMDAFQRQEIAFVAGSSAAGLAYEQHLLNPRNALARQHGGSSPVTVSSDKLAAEEGWFDQHPAFRTAADQLASSDRSPAAMGAMMGDQTGIGRVLMAAMHDVLTTGADPDTRFRAATEQAQALLDRHNAACTADPPGTPDALDVL